VSTYGERKSVFRVLVEKPEGRGYLKDPGIDGRIILQWIFEKWDRRVNWLDMAQDRNR
jgi:hypothetical protein